MDNTVIIGVALLVFFVIILVAFAVFAVGFLIGYKFEDKKIFRAGKTELIEMKDTEEEKRFKREWKNFLKYDGSALDKNEV